MSNEITDSELLELAAKAAGYTDVSGSSWNPLTDDADAFRLMVKIGLRDYFGVEVATDSVETTCFEPLEHTEFEYHKEDPYAATRRSIVRTAAEIVREETND
jgi:hypothetical protein